MKTHAKFRLKNTVVALALAYATCGSQAWANPTGGTVVNGSATFVTSGNTLTVTNTNNTIINWQGFSIGAGETTRFTQPTSASAVLNRVTTQSVSSILGSLQSNGRVFLVNPNGILFSSGAQVNTAGFTATTSTISDSAFLAGDTTPTGAGSTVSFDGLMTVDGRLTIGANGITTIDNLSFSGNATFLTSDNLSVNGSISVGGILNLDPQNITVNTSLSGILNPVVRVYSSEIGTPGLISTSDISTITGLTITALSNTSIGTNKVTITGTGTTLVAAGGITQNGAISVVGTVGGVTTFGNATPPRAIITSGSNVDTVAPTISGTPQPAPLNRVLGGSPQNPSVVTGNATFTNTGTNLNITNTPSAIINWGSFAIAPGDATRFVQQSSSSAVLNRVTNQQSPPIGGVLQTAPIATARTGTLNTSTIGIASSVAANTASTSARAATVSINLQKREPLF